LYSAHDVRPPSTSSGPDGPATPSGTSHLCPAIGGATFLQTLTTVGSAADNDADDAGTTTSASSSAENILMAISFNESCLLVVGQFE
jgi:hypothetical protein